MAHADGGGQDDYGAKTAGPLLRSPSIKGTVPDMQRALDEFNWSNYAPPGKKSL